MLYAAATSIPKIEEQSQHIARFRIEHQQILYHDPEDRMIDSKVRLTFFFNNQQYFKAHVNVA